MENENILTIDIGASKIRIQAVNIKGDFGFMNTANLVGLNINNDSFLDFIAELIKSFINSNKDTVFKAISIGCPGPLDAEKGIILNPPNLKGIVNLPITDELKKIFDMPVFLLNDADAALLGEQWSGAGRLFKNIVYITLSSGVGSGILKDGGLEPKVELGHKPLEIKGEKRVCSCGGDNHAEAYLSAYGLARTYAGIFEINYQEMMPEDIYNVSFEMREGLAKNDGKWMDVEDKYIEHLSVFIGEINSNYHPEIIILGGGISFGNLSLLRKVANNNVKISLAQLGNNVNLGAAKYALEQLGG